MLLLRCKKDLTYTYLWKIECCLDISYGSIILFAHFKYTDIILPKQASYKRSETNQECKTETRVLSSDKRENPMIIYYLSFPQATWLQRTNPCLSMVFDRIIDFFLNKKNKTVQGQCATTCSNLIHTALSMSLVIRRLTEYSNYLLSIENIYGFSNFNQLFKS